MNETNVEFGNSGHVYKLEPDELGKLLWLLRDEIMPFGEWNLVFVWALSQYENLSDFVHVWIDDNLIDITKRAYNYRPSGGYHYYSRRTRVAFPDSQVKHTVDFDSETELINAIDNLKSYYGDST